MARLTVATVNMARMTANNNKPAPPAARPNDRVQSRPNHRASQLAGERIAGQTKTNEGERLSKRVAELVPCSRREAEQYIEGGWVMVDGQVVEEPMFRVSAQKVAIDPHASLLELAAVTLLLHKPPGYDAMAMPGEVTRARTRAQTSPSSLRSICSSPKPAPRTTPQAPACSSATLPSSPPPCRWKPPPAAWSSSRRIGAWHAS